MICTCTKVIDLAPRLLDIQVMDWPLLDELLVGRYKGETLGYRQRCAALRLMRAGLVEHDEFADYKAARDVPAYLRGRAAAFAGPSAIKNPYDGHAYPHSHRAWNNGRELRPLAPRPDRDA